MLVVALLVPGCVAAGPRPGPTGTPSAEPSTERDVRFEGRTGTNACLFAVVTATCRMVQPSVDNIHALGAAAGLSGTFAWADGMSGGAKVHLLILRDVDGEWQRVAGDPEVFAEVPVRVEWTLLAQPGVTFGLGVGGGILIENGGAGAVASVARHWVFEGTVR